jgi:hypothetical protein
MTSALVFNPFTAIERYTAADGGPALTTRSFARGRSLIRTNFRRVENPELFEALASWAEGGPVPRADSMPGPQRIDLWSRGLLISEGELAALPDRVGPVTGEGDELAAAIDPEIGKILERGPQLTQVPNEAAVSLAGVGYCQLPQLFSGQDCGVLRGWYRVLSDGQWLKPDGHLTTQKVIHSDPVTRVLQRALLPQVERLSGAQLKPSFSYVTEYHSSAPLPRHTDREQCEFTLSIYADYEPAPADGICPWPLVLHTESGEIRLHTPSFGGVLFRGRKIPHSRPELPEGHRARLILLCFVERDFAGPLE